MSDESEKWFSKLRIFVLNLFSTRKSFRKSVRCDSLEIEEPEKLYTLIADNLSITSLAAQAITGLRESQQSSFFCKKYRLLLLNWYKFSEKFLY